MRQVLLLSALLLFACSPTPARHAAEVPGAPAEQQTLVVAIRVEPNTLTTKVLQSAGNLTLDGTRGLFNANLARMDGSGVPYPQLATQLPKLHGDDWRVFPDGRMETIYRLKPNLTWHDGMALSAKDFAFAW